MNYDFTKHLIYCEDKDRYKKIENIDKKFNFTNTIAYEFARRNENVINILNLLEGLNFLYEKRFKEELKLLKELSSSSEISILKKEFLERFKFIVIFLLKKYDRKDLIIVIRCIKIENIVRELNGVFEVLAEELYDKYYLIYQLPTDYSKVKEMICHSIELSGLELNTWFRDINPKIEYNGDYYSNDMYNPKKYIERDPTLSEMFNSLSNEDRAKIELSNSNDSFTSIQIKKGNKKEYYINTIYPKNDCPMRDFTDIKIAINLKLPEDELISYIREIKKEYNRDNSIIKTNMELLKDQLEITEDESENIRKSKGRQEKLSKDKRYNWADMFFIYDYYTQQREFNNKSFERIKEELLKIFSKKYGVDIIKNNKVDKNLTWEEYLKEYHPGESEDEVDFADVQGVRPVISERTIREKYEIMKNYINGKNPKYKILLNY
ncbi:hypothetical protein [Halarcobacter bivalviorum]|uniref:hypothetical protein n=1 Tax=Halarcobacter bivalviorum TaxID=663364 RepID=UPI00100C317A|nr:hypothetical protein [Halarcobacter bivalviorum]RXK06485.1 hypothetical protein CRU97_04470 [Halarcobacter bivalviorum]